MPDQSEMIMPVSDQGAALQFFIEAMKANTAVLERVGKAMDGLNAEQKATLRMVTDTRERVIRLESGGQAEMITRLESKIEGLEKEVDTLTRDRDRREGAMSGLTWGLKYGPVLLAVLAAIILTLKATGQI